MPIVTFGIPRHRITRFHVTSSPEKILREGFDSNKGEGVGGEGNRKSDVFTSEDINYSRRLCAHMNTLERIRVSAVPLLAATSYLGKVVTGGEGEISTMENKLQRELTDAEKAMVMCVQGNGAFSELDPESFFVEGPMRKFVILEVNIENGRKTGESPEFGHEESWDPDTVEPLRLVKSDVAYNPSDRYAYRVHHHYQDKVIYIPHNRLRTPYQTDAATDDSKVRENVQRMQNGEYLKPVVIGYDYDVHDGHHRIEASKKIGYTHIPCVVGGRNRRRTRAAEARYRTVWKSVRLGGALLKSDSSDGHWVTVTKPGPLQGRHIKIDGQGNIIAGKGIPNHIIDHLNGQRKSGEFNHESHTKPYSGETDKQTGEPTEYQEKAKDASLGTTHQFNTDRVFKSGDEISKDFVDNSEKLSKHWKVSDEEQLNKIASTLGNQLASNEDFKKLSEMTGKKTPKDIAKYLLDEWRASSGRPSNLMQKAAIDEFNVHDAPTEHLKDNTGDHYEKYGAGIRSFLRAMYDNTQNLLKEKGLSHVTLYRGATFENGTPGLKFDANGVGVGKTEADLQPLSSFSLSPQMAKDYAQIGDGHHVVIAAQVPAERILSCGLTGIGYHNHSECVVLGGRNQQVNAVEFDNPDQVYGDKLYKRLAAASKSKGVK